MLRPPRSPPRFLPRWLLLLAIPGTAYCCSTPFAGPCQLLSLSLLRQKALRLGHCNAHRSLHWRGFRGRGVRRRWQARLSFLGVRLRGVGGKPCWAFGDSSGKELRVVSTECPFVDPVAAPAAAAAAAAAGIRFKYQNACKHLTLVLVQFKSLCIQTQQSQDRVIFNSRELGGRGAEG
eukprot:335443-Chlamydomonas_euryale.AAC.2